MTPEHKALVDALTRKAETDGLLSVEDIRSVAESLSAQSAQPQAGEVVGYVTPDSIAEVAAGRIGNHLFPKGTLRPENEVPVYVSPQPANPAQVTDADLDYGLKLIAEAIEAHFGDRDDAYKYEMGDTTIHDAWEAYDALTAAIGAGGQAVACKECDGTGFKDKNGARLTLARTPCGACGGSGYVAALSQPHPANEPRKLVKDIPESEKPYHGPFPPSAPADERVVEALRIAEERLSSLLARIHRDGGHYEAAHGTEKAWADADEIVARIYADDTHPAHSPAALAQEGRKNG